MNNLANKPPLGLKAPKTKGNTKYLERVRELPCCICEAYGEPQMSPTTAHHPIHDRHGTRKRPDETAIPLCDGHHQGLWDTTKLALHQAPQEWRNRYGPDTDWIAATQDKIDD